jgi:hypothetical protein
MVGKYGLNEIKSPASLTLFTIHCGYFFLLALTVVSDLCTVSYIFFADFFKPDISEIFKEPLLDF